MAATVRRFSFPVARWRYAAGDTRNADGYMVPPAPASAAILAHVTPAPGKVIEQLPEGHQGKRTVMVYTADDVIVDDNETGTRGDVIVHNGAAYLIVMLADWNGGSLGARTYQAFAAVLHPDPPGVTL